MTVKLADVVAEMKQAVTDSASSLESRKRKIHGLAADFLVRAIARDPERGDVGILMRVHDASMLTFTYPPHLARGNLLPLDRESIAGRVVLGGRPVVENEVKSQPHKHFFERIPNARGEVRPIQKMVAAPILAADGEAVGVVEVSRVGDAATTAGEDFTERDAENLAKCCRAFAPFILRTWIRDGGDD